MISIELLDPFHESPPITFVTDLFILTFMTKYNKLALKNILIYSMRKEKILYGGYLLFRKQRFVHDKQLPERSRRSGT